MTNLSQTEKLLECAAADRQSGRGRTLRRRHEDVRERRHDRGGGASLTGGTKAAIQSSNPIANGWSAVAIGTGSGSAGSQTLTVDVVCTGP